MPDMNHFDDELMEHFERNVRIISFVMPIIIGLVIAVVVGVPLYIHFIR